MAYRIILLTLAVTLALFGAVISGYLVSEHLGGEAPAWFEAGCSSEEGSKWDCSSVLNSRWAYIPPKPDPSDLSARAREPGTSIPSALLGMMYFSMLGVWYLLVGQPQGRSRLWQVLPIGFNTLGVLFSLYFINIMFTKMDTRCPWCLASHAANFGLIVCSILLWPRRVRESAVSDDGATSEAAESETSAHGERNMDRSRSHPTLRLVFAALVAAVSVGLVELYYANAKGSLAQTKQYQKYIESLSEDLGFVLGSYRNSPKHDIPIRPDDPVIGGKEHPLRLVVFSDFECSHCREFAQTIERDLRPYFEGALQVIFKHYPGNQECNPVVKRTIHPSACEAAEFAEAARMQGGSEAFWKAHDFLFKHQDELKQLNPLEAAAELGLDGSRLLQDMNSPETLERIREDARLAETLDVNSTPSPFLSGRYIPPLSRSSKVFWVEIKKGYEATVARLEAKASDVTTPDSPDPSVDD